MEERLARQARTGPPRRRNHRTGRPSRCRRIPLPGAGRGLRPGRGLVRHRHRLLRPLAELPLRDQHRRGAGKGARGPRAAHFAADQPSLQRGPGELLQGAGHDPRGHPEERGRAAERRPCTAPPTTWSGRCGCIARSSGDEALAAENLRQAQRELTWYVDDAGCWVFRGRFTPEQGAVIAQALEAALEIQFRERRDEPGRGGGGNRARPGLPAGRGRAHRATAGRCARAGGYGLPRRPGSGRQQCRPLHREPAYRYRDPASRWRRRRSGTGGRQPLLPTFPRKRRGG